MLIYRIDRAKYTDSVLTGQGAMLNGGRWNHKNTAAVYASASRALALVEILVHVRKSGLMPKDRIVVTLEVPEEYIVLLPDTLLDASWNNTPNGPISNKNLFETEVIRSGKLGMAVPSVVLPKEKNYVLYPNASSYSKVSIVEVIPLDWGYRL